PILFLAWLLKILLSRMDGTVRTSTRGRIGFSTVAIAATLCAALISQDAWIGQEPFWAREIGKNSIFALFSAYNKNSINYGEFYSSIDSKQAFDLTRDWLHGNFVKPDALVRNITSKEPEKHWNVVLVVMESLSAG